jgi:hypothetical protein
MWIDPLSLLIGAGIPVLTLYIQSREKQKYYELEIKEKLKLLVVEKRIEAHQKAFALWYELQEVIFPKGDYDKQSKVFNKAYEFWNNNALYLEKNTRNDFRKVITVISGYADEIMEYRQEADPIEKKHAKKAYLDSWNFIQSVHATIQQEVMLEPLRPELDINSEGEQINHNK